MMGKFKHGMSNTRVFKTWLRMIDRCKNDRQGTYGKRGITVCQRWLDSFEAFYQDMGDPPSPGHSIDRYPDNDGNYEPSNCRWATKIQQARNTSRNTILTMGGKSKTLAEWSEITGIKEPTICVRLASGWSHERALSEPIQARVGTPWKDSGMSRSAWYRARGGAL